MDYGFAIIVGAIMGSFTFIIRDIAKEAVEGLWLRFSDEINMNDKVEVMRRGKALYKGKVKGIGLRNTLIKDNSKRKNSTLIENSKIFNWEVKKLNEKGEEKIY